MSVVRLPALSQALVTVSLCGTAPAVADLSAQDLWTDWQAAATAQGLEMTAATVTPTANGLEIADITVVLSEGDAENSRLTANVPQVTMVDAAGGTVLVTMPGGKTLTLSQAAGEQAPDTVQRAVMTIATDGLVVNASGDRAATIYTWAAPEISARLTEFEAIDAPEEVALSLVLRDMAGRATGYDATPEGPVTALFEAAEAVWSLSMANPDAKERLTSAATQTDVVIQAESIFPEAEGDSPDAGTVRFAYETGSGTLSSGQEAAGQTQRSDVSHAAASVRVDVTPETAMYTAGVEEVAVTLDDPGLPFRPFSFGVAEVDAAFAGPVDETGDVAAPFDVTLGLIGFELSELILSRFDPTGLLPRTPLNMALDLTGMALQGNMTSVSGVAGDMSNQFVPTEMTVQNFALDYGDASAQATGAFAFPTPDEVAQSGGAMMQPEGTLTVRLNGLFDLLDRFAQIGLVPEQQMMGLQMMMGMFATPQDDGSLLSVIETTRTGGLIVNGNQLR